MAMQTRQWHLGGGTDSGLDPITPATLEGIARDIADLQAHWVLVFGDVSTFEPPPPGADHEAPVAVFHRLLRTLAPHAALMGCSTAGEITRSGFHTGSLVITAVHLPGGQMAVVQTAVDSAESSLAAGVQLAAALQATHRQAEPGEASPLHHVWVLGPGVDVNGSALVAGLQQALGSETRLSGGLAGDGGAFQRTYTVGPDGVHARQCVAAGFWNPSLRGVSAAAGGWEAFGPARRITRARGTRLAQLDHASALDIYRRYLGEYAKDLPASALLFPLQVASGPDQGLIRTILGIDESTGELILAGDVQEGEQLRLMHASTSHLVGAAEAVVEPLKDADVVATAPSLALLVSCVGRRIVMGTLTDEEVEAVTGALPPAATVAGFYSNGEIAAFKFFSDCRLHNQTMTLTWLGERSTPAIPASAPTPAP